MANETAKIDANFKHALTGVTDDASKEIRNLLVDPTTGKLKVSATISSISGTYIAGHIKRDEFTSTNNQTVFTASQTVIADMIMIVNGQIQSPTFDYTLVGNVYTLNSGIPAGLPVILIYIY